jgi:peptide/nickel transport system permease protein
MKLPRAAAALLVTLVAGGFFTFWLVRIAPGYDTDPSELDTRRSAASVSMLRDQSRDSRPVWQAYGHYLARVGQGDFGMSRAWGVPVARLLGERGKVTLRAAGSGLLLGWIVAIALALAVSSRMLRWIVPAGRAAAASVLSIPSPALAVLLCLCWRHGTAEWRVAAAVAMAVFARVLVTSTAVVAAARREPYIVPARARGLSRVRLAVAYVLRRAAPALAALLVTAVPMAFGVTIPVETVCNLPGVGQLAWLAAQKRDLPVLTGMTLALLTLTLLCGAMARAASRATVGWAERDAA